MLARRNRELVLLAMTVLTAMACISGNATTAYLLGYGYLIVLLWALAITALPLALGHLFYEHILAKHRRLQTILILASVVLCFGGIFKLGQTRNLMVSKAVAQTTTNLYVDGADTTAQPEASTEQDSESAIRYTLGEAMFLMTLAAELVLGMMVARLTRLLEDEDYAAWRKLKQYVSSWINSKTKSPNSWHLLRLPKSSVPLEYFAPRT